MFWALSSILCWIRFLFWFLVWALEGPLWFAPKGAEWEQALDDWQARVSVEEELADHELPGVEVTASALPHVPLPPWYERDPTLPRDTAGRCPTLGPFLLAVVGVLLTEATNIHLSGYADRVRPCEAPDCRTPFLDAGDGRRRRFCSPRCRARQSARARARVR